MNRLTDNDKNFGPFTLRKWSKRISIELSSGDGPRSCYLLLVGFGWALRVKLPNIIKPYRGQAREYGVCLSDMGNGYDFFSLSYGPDTGDSSTTKAWHKHIPWKQWRCVRNSLYNPDGSHFATKGSNWCEFFDLKEKCPAVQFLFEDYDGEKITATCRIEEREWHRGEGWFKWLRHFYPAKIRRSLDLKFDKEVGPEKGSWKGGTIGHGIVMLAGETPRQAFERYCQLQHSCKGRSFKLKFLGEACAASICG